MIRALPHILARVFNVPLLIAPARAQALVSGLSAVMLQRGPLEAAANELTDEARPPPEQQPQRPRGYRIDRGVAMLPVRGVLVRRAGQIDSDSTPLQSYESTRASLRTARSDPRVRGILLELDTPGGEAGGIFELANEVRATTKDKPVWAIANDDALSAGYAIAAAAQKLWITDTGAAGSIGVVALHLDQSGFDEEHGFKFSYIYKGQHKIDAHPHGPLSAQATGAIQGEVDRLYGMLIANVAGHRGKEPERMASTEAAIFCGANAVSAGLVDQLGTFDQAQAAMAEHVAPIAARRLAAASSNQGTRQMENEETTVEQVPSNEPAPAPAPAANVVSFDQMHAAVAAARSQAGEVASLCALAGYPDMASEEINAGTSIEAVRQRLQQRRAADDTKRQVEAIDTTAKPASSTVAEVTAAANARFAAQRQAHNHA